VKTSWTAARLGDVCEIDKTQGVHCHLPYVGLEHIESHTARFIGSSKPRSVKSSSFKFSRKHVLYGRLRPYLNKVLAPDFEGHCSTEIFPIRPGSRLSREYLVYWLLAGETVNRINATCTGARMPRADMNDVLEFEFPLPPLHEQERLVGILGEALAGIATAKANAERNLQNARALFESRLDSVFALRGEGWEDKALADLCDIKHGFAFKSEFFEDEGDYVLLTPGNFHESGGYRDRGAKQKYYSGEVPAGSVLAKGDLVVAMTEQAAGLLGSPVLVPESDKFLHNQRLGLVTAKPGAPWTNEFFFHVFNTRAVRRAIHEGASGVKVRHTSPTKIGEVVVSFPSVPSEQQRIVVKLAELRELSQRLESTCDRKLASLDKLRSSLLHQAFTGQL